MSGISRRHFLLTSLLGAASLALSTPKAFAGMSLEDDVPTDTRSPPSFRAVSDTFSIGEATAKLFKPEQIAAMAAFSKGRVLLLSGNDFENLLSLPSNEQRSVKELREKLSAYNLTDEDCQSIYQRLGKDGNPETFPAYRDGHYDGSVIVTKGDSFDANYFKQSAGLDFPKNIDPSILHECRLFVTTHEIGHANGFIINDSMGHSERNAEKEAYAFRARFPDTYDALRDDNTAKGLLAGRRALGCLLKDNRSEHRILPFFGPENYQDLLSENETGILSSQPRYSNFALTKEQLRLTHELERVRDKIASEMYRSNLLTLANPHDESLPSIRKAFDETLWKLAMPESANEQEQSRPDMSRSLNSPFIKGMISTIVKLDRAGDFNESKEQRDFASNIRAGLSYYLDGSPLQHELGLSNNQSAMPKTPKPSLLKHMGTGHTPSV